MFSFDYINISILIVIQYWNLPDVPIEENWLKVTWDLSIIFYS